MVAKCTKCVHEWMLRIDSPLLKVIASKSVIKRLKAQGALTCDWCGAPGEIIGKDWRDDHVGDMG